MLESRSASQHFSWSASSKVGERRVTLAKSAEEAPMNYGFRAKGGCDPRPFARFGPCGKEVS